MKANDLTRYDIMRGNPCGSECCAEMVSWINGDYVLHADAQAALAARDAALAELLDAMKHARAAFERDYADMILDEAIAKHRPEEGADK